MHSNARGSGLYFLSLTSPLKTLLSFLFFIISFFILYTCVCSSRWCLSLVTELFACLFGFSCPTPLSLILVTVIYIVTSAYATRSFPHIRSTILHHSRSYAAFYFFLHFLCLTSESLLGVGLLRDEIKPIIKQLILFEGDWSREWVIHNEAGHGYANRYVVTYYFVQDFLRTGNTIRKFRYLTYLL